MQDWLTVKRKWVDVDHRLHLEASGSVFYPVANRKLRIIVMFLAGGRQRRFPVDAFCVSGEGTGFQMRAEISLPDVFQDFDGADSKTAEVKFCYCDAEGSWHTFPESVSLECSDFRRSAPKRTLLYSIYQKAAYVICTLLLPLWLLDGFFVWKGCKKSVFARKEVTGKKILFYHAHDMVKMITGYGYSIREYKTKYFARKYDKYCKRIPETGGVLFLSEREAVRGGNLDLVREAWKRSGWEYEEFIDTRAIHRLPFSEIRRVAKLAASAKVIVLEDFYPQINALRLREETKLVQLWHACGAFKLFGLSEMGKVEQLGQDTRNHRNYSYAFTSSAKIAPFYSEAFGIEDSRVKPLGVPRTDVFFKEGYRQRAVSGLLASYPALEGKRVVLFAPTFRGSGKKTAYYPSSHFSVDAFMEGMPEDVVLVIKNHPFVKETFSWSERYAGRVLDLTGKENINDILFAASLLITDYSSCIFEAALLRVPMLFYVFDLEEYIESRDFYFDFASFAPGRQVCDFDGVVREAADMISGAGQADEKQLEAFTGYFMDALDGGSTGRIVEFIRELSGGS